MTIADELRKLQELHDAGSLTDAEFAAAKAKVLSSQAAPSSAGTDQAMRQHLQDIKRQNEVEQLDRQWALERDQYRSEEHTSELQSLRHLVCRLLLEKKKQ